MTKTKLRTLSYFTALALVLFGSCLAFAASEKLMTVPDDKKNVIQFTSTASLETIVGKTSAVSGSLDLDKDSLTNTSSGFFEVDLNTLDTGISMRDKDMKTKFLNVAAYPKAMFNLKKIVSADQPGIKVGETVNCMAQGDFTIHGVSKEYTIPIKLSYMASNAETVQRLSGGKGDILSIQADFGVKLADHNIDRPQFILLRLSEEEKVSVSMVMTDQLPEKK